jgi:hypothetical protein
MFCDGAKPRVRRSDGVGTRAPELTMPFNVRRGRELRKPSEEVGVPDSVNTGDVRSVRKLDAVGDLIGVGHK